MSEDSLQQSLIEKIEYQKYSQRDINESGYELALELRGSNLAYDKAIAIIRQHEADKPWGIEHYPNACADAAFLNTVSDSGMVGGLDASTRKDEASSSGAVPTSPASGNTSEIRDNTFHGPCMECDANMWKEVIGGWQCQRCGNPKLFMPSNTPSKEQDGSTVRIPTSADEAALMCLLGKDFLTRNNPERLREPVSVSLNKCLKAVDQIHLPLHTLPDDEFYKVIAKAVLNAAGVKYVD